MLAFLRFKRVAACSAVAAAAVTALACGAKTAIDSTPDRGTGGGGVSCEELDAEYIVQFKLARVCSPEVGVVQCTLAEGSQLFCPCPHLVNPANGAAISKLSDLRAAWAAKSCPPMPPACDAGICGIADAGTCTPQPQGSSASGLCDDKY